MILWGNIRDFPLFTILQFLAAQRKTGLLEIEDFEEHGCIYMNQGGIDAISLPLSDETLGQRLIAAGAMTSKMVRECWMEHSEDDLEKPVVATLLRAARQDRDVLVDVVNRHTADQVMQLMYWSTGTFRLSPTAEPVVFPIVPSLNMENLLLDAYRRVDEGERPPREKLASDEEFCLTCTLECSDAIKARYLKADVCLWRNMPSILKDPIFRGRRSSRPLFGQEDVDLDFLG